MDKVTLLNMLERMYTIHFFEETLQENFTVGKIPGFIHLYKWPGGGGRRGLFCVER